MVIRQPLSEDLLQNVKYIKHKEADMQIVLSLENRDYSHNPKDRLTLCTLLGEMLRPLSHRQIALVLTHQCDLPVLCVCRTVAEKGQGQVTGERGGSVEGNLHDF